MNALEKSMKIVGQSVETREVMIDALKKIEVIFELNNKNIDVRTEIIAPIVDALFSEDQILNKSLQDDTHFNFLYRSKIARDFLLSEPKKPDHVWEPQTTKLLLELTKNAKQVLIGGAYFGDQTILIAKNIAVNNGICHAFEPNKEQYGMLLDNGTLNGLSNIKANQLGLWHNSSSTLRLVGDDSFAHPEEILNTDNIDKNTFKTISIDDYLSALQVEQLDLIMLDLEGAEFSVLKGAHKYISMNKKCPDIVFEVHKNYVDWSNGSENTDIVKYLLNFGYSIYAVRDFNTNVDMVGCKVELIPVDKVYLEGPPHGFNMFATKNPSIIEDKSVFRICEGISPKLLKHKEPKLHHPTEWL